MQRTDTSRTARFPARYSLYLTGSLQMQTDAKARFILYARDQAWAGARGIQDEKPMDRGNRVCFCVDPDGHVLAFDRRISG